MNFYMRTISRSNDCEKFFNSKTQLEYYIENDSHPNTINLAKLNNKSFGEKMQKIIINLLNLDPPENPGHDATKKNLKFEIKSSRYWIKLKDFKWQHIMEYHDYDYLILTGLDFHEIIIYILSKKDLIKLKENNKIKMQGGAEGQGLWFERKKIEKYLTKIDNKNEFYSSISISSIESSKSFNSF